MTGFDVAVVGAGIVGLAAAQELLQRHPALRVAVLDKEAAPGLHQTGHNSGVIHSGIYYAPGSLKARLCVEGGAALYRYCETHGIPTDRCGKVIVATEAGELAPLEALYERGRANGVEGLEVIGSERLREIEPHCRGLRALWSPGTGIVDFRRVAASYAEDIRAAGGVVLVNHEVRQVTEYSSSLVLHTSSGPIEARCAIACAGLQSDRLARRAGAPADPRIIPFRGDYWVLRPNRRHLVRNLIYPVPDPSFPFLGVHFTRRIDDGSVWLGPNAVLALAREGYRRTDLRIADLGEALAFGGFRKLAARYWRTGLDELVRDFSKAAFLRSLHPYLPELTMDDLLPGPAGVRAQAVDAEGHLVDDFVVHQQGRRMIHVRNAPSPAATSSLAIGRLIADEADRAFDLAAS